MCVQEWSEEESEEDERQQPISREDSGIQADSRTPQEDQEQNDKMVQVTWTGKRPAYSRERMTLVGD